MCKYLRSLMAEEIPHYQRESSLVTCVRTRFLSSSVHTKLSS